MHSYMCCHGQHKIQMVCICCLVLTSAALSWLVGEADSPTIRLHSPLAQLALDLNFFLKVCIPTHWIFDFSGFSAVSITDNILRALLCSGWYFRLFRVMTFFEGVWSVQVNLRALSVRLGIEVPSWSYWKSLSYLQVDVYISTLSVRGILVVSSCSCGSLLIKGLQSFWRDFFISARNVPGGCFPTSLYRCPLTKKVTWGDVPFYPMGLFYQFFLVL